MITSKLFRFLVGSERKEFTVHSHAVSRLSNPLNSLINGDMTEAREGIVVWDDMEPDTFVRVLEFAYRGDYTTPKLEPRAEPYRHTYEQLSPSDQEKLKSISPQDITRDIAFTPEEVDKLHHNAQRWVRAPYVTPGPTYDPEEPDEIDLDYAELLFCHVNLYVFGDKYFIEDLKALTTYKLHRTLLAWPKLYEILEDVADVTRFTYENTTKRDKMRMLLSHFVSLHFGISSMHPAITHLMEEVGEVSFDVAKHLSDDVTALEEEMGHGHDSEEDGPE